MGLGAVAEIEIDQALIRDAFVFSEGFEILDGVFVDSNSYLLFQLLGVRVFGRLGKIVVITHFDNLHKFVVLVGSPFVRI